MRALMPVAVAVLIVGSAAQADSLAPAWQSPGYVMEEIVATAPAAAERSPLRAAPEIYNNEWVVNARVPAGLTQLAAPHERAR